MAPETAYALVEQGSDGSVIVSGTLTSDTVPEVWGAGRQLLGAAVDPVLDLGAVSRCDSAGAAMIVAWVASHGSKRVLVRAMPAQMRAILDVSDLGALVSGETAD